MKDTIDLKHVKRAFIISDTHLGARSNSIEWLGVMTDWFHEDFLPKVRKEYKPGDVLIHCGDVFDNRQSVNLLVLHEGIRLFEELSKIFVDGIYVIAGNHDVMRKTSNDVSSLDVLKYIPNVNIIKEPVMAEFANRKALFMPWRSNDEEEKECLNEFKKYDCNYLFCHTNIRNLRFDSNRQVEEGLKLSDIEDFTKVYSGHIHWGQRTNNVTMIGNPYQMTRSDSGNEKGWYLLDIETSDHTFNQNQHSPKFIKIYLNRYLEKTITELEDICRNNRVDLYVPSSYLLKYQITPIIDILSKVTRKLEVIPFEQEMDDNELYQDESTAESFNIYGLCEKYVGRMASIDDTSKQKVLDKLKNLHNNVIKETK